MTLPDPDEPDRRAGGTRPGEAGPQPPDSTDPTDRTFADIVAGWRSEPDAPQWPGNDAPAAAEPAAPEPPPDPVTDSAVDDDHDDHYVPPEPPPLPTLQPRTIGGLLILAVGVLLLVAPGVLNLADRVSVPLGLLTLTGGFVWLALGLRAGPPPDSGWDDGAQL